MNITIAVEPRHWPNHYGVRPSVTGPWKRRNKSTFFNAI